MCGLTDKPMLEKLYSRASLFLFPSLYDANSLVQIEAACQGTPTVFLEGARTAATVTPGVNGYVSPATEEAYAHTLLDILADKDGYARVCAAAHRDLCLNHLNITRGNPALAAVGELDVGEAGNIVQDAHAGAFVEDEQVLGAIR